MIYRHKEHNCGGEVDLKSRTCLRCKKHWNWFTFLFSPFAMRADTRGRPATDSVRKLALGKTKIAKWADGHERISWFASHLPNWPRWARILSSLIVVGGLVIGLVVLWKLIFH